MLATVLVTEAITLSAEADLVFPGVHNLFQAVTLSKEN